MRLFAGKIPAIATEVVRTLVAVLLAYRLIAAVWEKRRSLNNVPA